MIIYKIPSLFNVDIYYCGEVINNFALHIEHIEVSDKDYPTLARIKVCEELFTFKIKESFNMFNMDSTIKNMVYWELQATLFIELEEDYGISFTKI
jgi:hypothetical protein